MVNYQILLMNIYLDYFLIIFMLFLYLQLYLWRLIEERLIRLLRIVIFRYLLVFTYWFFLYLRVIDDFVLVVD